jgi:AmiR/NasT family two-component response regulator
VTEGDAALRVLIADEDRAQLEALASVLEELGHEVAAHAVSVSEAAQVIAEEEPAVAIVALHEDEDHALGLIDEIVEYASGPVIAVIEREDAEFVRLAAERGIYAYAQPLTPPAVQGAIEVAVRRRAEAEELEERVDQLESALERRGVELGRARAARADVRVAESQLLPRLSVRGEFTYAEEPTLNLDWQRDASIGATLSVPLYQGGGEYARVRQTKQTVRQRQDDLEATFRNVREEVTAAWQALTTARTQIESFTEQVRAAEIALEGTRQEALVGQRTTLDVLDQEQDLFQAQVDLVSARREEILASYRLKSAVGQLTVVGVGLPVEPYEPEAYYSDVRNRLIGLGEDLDGRR